MRGQNQWTKSAKAEIKNADKAGESATEGPGTSTMDKLKKDRKETRVAVVAEAEEHLSSRIASNRIRINKETNHLVSAEGETGIVEVAVLVLLVATEKRPKLKRRLQVRIRSSTMEAARLPVIQVKKVAVRATEVKAVGVTTEKVAETTDKVVEITEEETTRTMKAPETKKVEIVPTVVPGTKIAGHVKVKTVTKVDAGEGVVPEVEEAVVAVTAMVVAVVVAVMVKTERIIAGVAMLAILAKQLHLPKPKSDLSSANT